MDETAPLGKIYFLNTGMSDCILLESEGDYALIDAAEDTDYPKNKPHLKYKGYEDTVVDFLLRRCRGADGRATLDFVLGTHAHSDHLGGFDTVALHEEIRISEAYLRPYDPGRVNHMERKFWDNQEVHDQMREALDKKGVPVCEDFDGKQLSLGAMQLTFFYCGIHNSLPIRYGENANSVVTLLEAGGTRALLAADMNYKTGDEKRIGRAVGQIDLLKVGHHGTVGSTSAGLLRALKPRIAVVTNKRSGIFPDVRLKLKRVCKEIYTTVESDGVCAALYANGEIRMQTGIMANP